jgi:hypothetical protein
MKSEGRTEALALLARSGRSRAVPPPGLLTGRPPSVGITRLRTKGRATERGDAADSPYERLCAVQSRTNGPRTISAPPDAPSKRPSGPNPKSPTLLVACCLERPASSALSNTLSRQLSMSFESARRRPHRVRIPSEPFETGSARLYCGCSSSDTVLF